MFFIDFEASGLDKEESYPIQVAVLNQKTGDSLSFMIAPVDGWTHWDEVAEGIHNIPRDMLPICGEDVAVVANALNDFIQGDVYCDGIEFDSFWWDRLFEAAGVEPIARIRSVYELVEYSKIDEMRNHLHFASFTHNAEEDVRQISEITMEYC